jgi:hypothetical protein
MGSRVPDAVQRSPGDANGRANARPMTGSASSRTLLRRAGTHRATKDWAPDPQRTATALHPGHGTK